MNEKSIMHLAIRLAGATWLLVALVLAWVAWYGDGHSDDIVHAPPAALAVPMQAAEVTAPARKDMRLEQANSRRLDGS